MDEPYPKFPRIPRLSRECIIKKTLENDATGKEV